jgi:hypothetical protein
MGILQPESERVDGSAFERGPSGINARGAAASVIVIVGVPHRRVAGKQQDRQAGPSRDAELSGFIAHLAIGSV